MKTARETTCTRGARDLALDRPAWPTQNHANHTDTQKPMYPNTIVFIFETHAMPHIHKHPSPGPFPFWRQQKARAKSFNPPCPTNADLIHTNVILYLH